MAQEQGRPVMPAWSLRTCVLLPALLLSLGPASLRAQPVPVEDDEEAELAAALPKVVLEATPEAEPEPEPEPTPAPEPVKPAAAPAPAPEVRPVDARPLAAEGMARNILHVTADRDAIGEHWRQHRQLLAARDGKRAQEHLAEIERLRDSLSFENLFDVSSALVREAAALRQSGQEAAALDACQTAVRLSPDLSQAHACVLSSLLSTSPFAVGAILDAMSDGVRASLRDLRSRRHVLTDEAITVVAAVVIACALLVLLLIVRYAGLFFHDFHHLFPRGVSRWQSVCVAIVLIALPALLGLGVLGSVVAAAVAVSFFLSRGEAVALGVAFGVLAASQFVVGAAVRGGAFGTTAHDVYLLERGDAPLASVVRLERRVADGLGDSTTASALGRYYKRIGRYAQAATFYAKALEFRPNDAATLNNLANVRFLQGDTDAAIELYRKANTTDPSLAEPLHNLAKMYFREGKLAQGEEAQRAAVALGGSKVTDRIGVQDDTRANVYVLDLPLPDEAIEAVAGRETESVRTFGGPVIQGVAGAGGSKLAAVIAAVPVVFVLLGALVQRRLRPATRCDKCGRAVCSRCDPELGATSGLCAQCISVFVRRSGVDPPDRIRKEISVRKFRHRQRLLVRLVAVLVGGGGHVLSGRLVAGTLFLMVFSALVAQAIFQEGFLPAPVALPTAVSPVRLGALAVALLSLCVLSVRHLVRHEDGE